MSLRAREPESESEPASARFRWDWTGKVLRERIDLEYVAKNVEREEIFHFLERFSVLH